MSELAYGDKRNRNSRHAMTTPEGSRTHDS